MPVTVQGPDGNTYQFPDGTDKTAAIGYFKKKGISVPKLSGSIVGAGAVPIPPKMQQGPSHQEQNQQNLREGFKGVGKEFLGTAQGVSHLVAPKGSFFDTPDVANTKATNKEQLAGKVVGAGLEAMAPVGRVAESLPSRKVGAELFKDVMANAANVPVNLTRSGDALLRAREISDAGTSMPQAVSKLLRRVTDPNKPAPTYEEMRDFYTNISSLSANEMSRISPVMKRQIGLIAKGLKDDIGDAAGQAGQAAKYYAAMKNYSQASKLLRAAHTIGKWAAGAAGAGGLYEGYQLLSKAAGGK